MLIAYGYHSELCYFTETIECQESPLEPGVPLVPNNATVIAPPTDYQEGYKPVFDEVYRVWEIKECHAGETVWEKATALPCIITYLGPIDFNTYTKIEPVPTEGKACVWNNETSTWDLVEDHRFEKLWWKENGKPTCVASPGPIPDTKTNKEPPETSEGFSPFWDETSSSWIIKEDHRGTMVWNKETFIASVINELGQIPDTVTTQEYPEYGVWDSATNAWKVDLDKAKNVSYARINTKAEALCNEAYTAYPNQMSRYQWKEEIARNFVKEAIPTDPTELAAFELKYAAIYGEVGVTAETASGVAQAIIDKADAWWAFAGKVETVRVVSKKQVSTATTVEEVLQIENSIAWPTL